MDRRLLFALILSLLVPACGGHRNPVSPAEAAGIASGTRGAEPTTLTRAAIVGAQSGASQGHDGSSASSHTLTGDPAGPARTNTLPLDVTLNRHCARRGDTMEAKAVSPPDTTFAFAAAYSDNDLIPDFTWVRGEANPTGTFTWTWVIRPTIPDGAAQLTVVASKDDKGASWNEPFRIASSC